jgi:hypothetical protein
MIKKIIITLLIISPIVILAIEFYSSPSRTDPPQVLVGTWATEAEIRAGKLQIHFHLSEDGTVDGTVGDAAMHNAYFGKNRGRLRKLLGMATHHIIVGDLNGSIISEIRCDKFYIILSNSEFSNKEFRGDIDCKECWKDGKKHASFGDGPLIYARIERP